VTARSVGLAVLVDVLVVLVFAAVGRSSHDDGVTAAGVAATAWPFLVGLAFGWLAAWGVQDATALRTGAAVWSGTVIVGMLLRTLGGDPPAVSFVLVAFLVVGVGQVGWRAVYAMVRRVGRTA